MAAAITIENLSKKFIIRQRKTGSSYVSLREVLASKAKRLLTPTAPRSETTQAQEFWALKDISLTVEQGDKLAIIGNNGAGKSTLLKILSQITEPSSGRVTIQGRVASLLEVGTGFHPELTGRENIFLNGSILGMSHSEIKRKFDEIVDFAGVETFLDTPVKRYSSGMRMRLGFGVAAHLESEILIIDEVLAVGDVEFQKKCLGKMDEISRNEGRTILFVSHNMGAITELCTHAHLLERGQLIYSGTTADAVARYTQSAQNETGDILCRDLAVSHYQLPIQQYITNAQPLNFTLTLQVEEDIPDCFFDIAIYNIRQEKVIHIFNEEKRCYFSLKRGSNALSYTVNATQLTAGSYFAILYVAQKGKARDLFSIRNLPLFDVIGPASPSGHPPILDPSYELTHTVL